MFEKLLKDGKFRTKKKASLAGAREFKKIFQGGIFEAFFGKRQYTEDEIIRLILKHGLAQNPEEAKKFFRSLLNQKVEYKRQGHKYYHWWWWFKFIEVSCGPRIKYEFHLGKEHYDIFNW